ncbi:MAG: TPM domain-containing protein [Candidatus Aenigmatarchaeota archaeon]
MRMKIIAILFAFLVVGIASAADVPNPVGFVNDYAGVLLDTGALEQRLSDLEKNTSVEFSIVTIDALPSDETIETYAEKIFNTWQIGKEQEDTGILFLLVENGTRGSRMRIETGYGIESIITAGRAGQILDEALLSYEEGDYNNATLIVTGLIIERITNVGTGGGITGRVTESSSWVLFPFFFLGFFILTSIIGWQANRVRCPKCRNTKLVTEKDVKGITDMYVCSNCGHKFKKRYANIVRGTPGIWGGGFAGGGSSGGFGGFGGGASGGGGASR